MIRRRLTKLRSVLTETKVTTAPTIAGLNILKNGQNLQITGKRSEPATTLLSTSPSTVMIDKLVVNDVDTTDEPLNE
ncbi:hypothetical protein PHMEG_00019620 [Phytophthora megakarya]|uniref:Uncharacterized protein n=1 Tax=Phytophthora megakarya TaxID=4795 RepID=A0A225VSN7_9STRA|nr:hypothetical protein PHMEG_00019620 [Phytophthora megakarya]